MLSKVRSFRAFLLIPVLLVTMVISHLCPVTVLALTPDFQQLNQSQIVAAMGAGWNLGNQLEANINGTPSETAWGNPTITLGLIQKVKAAGFKTIRIPVSYLDKIGSAPNYSIDAAWLGRIKEVVDYAYNEGLYVIINIHGDGYHSIPGAWLLVDSSNQTTIRGKYQKVWEQIANTFINYDERLIFESMNEVFDGNYAAPNLSYYSNLNTYNQIFVDTVRQTGGNNSARWLLVPGWNTNIDYTAGDYGFVIPTDTYRSSTIPSSEKRIMISAHYYSPWDFCGEENGTITQWGAIAADPYRKSTWGQEDYMESQVQMMYNKFVIEGYPVVLGEWGSIDKTSADPTNNTYREYFAKTFCSYSKQYGAVPVYWDNGYNGVYGFGLFDRSTLTVTQQGIIDSIMDGMGSVVPTPIPTPTSTTKPTPTPTEGPTPTPTPTSSFEPGQVRVEARGEESNPDVQSLIRMNVWNEDTAALNNLSVRYFVDLSEVYAAGYSAGNVTLDVYYSSAGVTVSPLTAYDTANRIYYYELDWGSYSVAPGARIEANFSIHLTGWQPAWDPANDWSYQGLSGSYTNTSYIPVYRAGGLIYGLEPDGSPPPTSTPTATPGPTPTPTPTSEPEPTPTPTPTSEPGPTPTPTPTSEPVGDYVVHYAIGNDWGSGATIDVTIINNTSAVVDGWVLEWTFSGNQQISDMWCADYTQTGASVTVENLDWNAYIPANGGSVSFGFNINYSGQNNAPAGFTLNEVPCGIQ